MRAGVQGRRRHLSNWPLLGFLFLIPLQNVQVGYLPNFGNGLNFLNVFFGLSLVGAWFTGGRLAPAQPVNRWVLAFALYSVVSLVIGYQYVSADEDHFNLLKDQLLGMFVVYLVQMSVNNWTDVRRIVLATLLPLPYIAHVVIDQHRSVAQWHYSNDQRIQGTFALLGANEFAAFCVTGAVLLFALLIAARLSRSWQLMVLAGIACLVLGVMYAYSRTAYVSLILGLVTVILAWRKRWKLALPLLLATMALPTFLPYSVVERFDSTTVEEGQRDRSTDLRFTYWQIAWDTFQRHPIVGTGYHTFHHQNINPYGTDTHNLYLRTLSEKGLIGAVMLLGVLLSVLLAAWRGATRAPTGSLGYALALGLLGAWAGLVCGNVFGDRFTYFPVVAYFWAYVALLLKAPYLPPENADGGVGVTTLRNTWSAT